MGRYTEDMKLWLFDLAHGNLDAQGCLQGFFKHYLMCGLDKDAVVQDIVFHTAYGVDGAKVAKDTLDALCAGIATGDYHITEVA